MSTVVVTGVTGFLGTALLPKLVEAGLAPVGVTRRPGSGHWTVASYADAPPGDILVHLAEDSDRARVNAAGRAAEHVAEETIVALRAKGFRKMVYASSAVLYGDQHEAAHPETDPIAVVDAYTQIKSFSEREVLAGGGTVARIANLYGPGMAGGNVLSKILGQVPGRDEVAVFTTRPVRDFVWVDDVADAIVRLVLSPTAGIFNVGTGVGTSVRDLACTVLAAAGESGRSIRSSGPPGAPSSLVLDIGRISRDTGWRPATLLSDGIRHLLELKKMRT